MNYFSFPLACISLALSTLPQVDAFTLAPRPRAVAMPTICCRTFETTRCNIALVGALMLLCLIVGHESDLDAMSRKFASRRGGVEKMQNDNERLQNKQQPPGQQYQPRNNGNISSVRYCAWHRDDQECMDLLLRQNEAGPAVSYQNRRWAFIGDSTMKRLHMSLNTEVMDKARAQCKCRYVQAERCNLNKAFGLPEPHQWIPPRPGLEGPVRFGKNNTNCNDCGGCFSAFWECQMPCNHASASFYALEHARDREIQTPTLKTSQEALVQMYLQKTQHATEYPFTCVVNTGLHEMGIARITTPRVLANIDWMLRVLRPVCRELIWIALTDVIGQKTYPQQSSRIMELNQAILEKVLVQDHFSDWLITVIDVFPASTTWEHDDNVHLNETYYKSLGSLFEKLESFSRVSSV